MKKLGKWWTILATTHPTRPMKTLGGVRNAWKYEWGPIDWNIPEIVIHYGWAWETSDLWNFSSHPSIP